MTTTCDSSITSSGQGRVRRPASSERRLAMLKRCGLFGNDTRGAVVTRACRWAELAAAYRLVHDAFVEKQYMLPRSSGTRVRPFETDRRTATFVAMADGEVVGVQSLVVDSDDLGLPSGHVFPVEIGSLWDPGRLVCEATNEAVAPAFRRSAVPTELMRCLYAHAVRLGCNELITTVSPGHKAFYEYMGFEQIGSERSFSTEVDDPVVLMCWHLDTVEERYGQVDPAEDTLAGFLKRFYITGNRYVEHIDGWMNLGESLFDDAEGVGSFFRQCPELFQDATPNELEAIRRRLGPVGFALACMGLESAAMSA